MGTESFKVCSVATGLWLFAAAAQGTEAQGASLMVLAPCSLALSKDVVEQVGR